MQSIRGKIERSRPFEWARDKSKNKSNQKDTVESSVEERILAEFDDPTKKAPEGQEKVTDDWKKRKDAKQKVLNLFFKDRDRSPKSKGSSTGPSRTPSVESSKNQEKEQASSAENTPVASVSGKPFHRAKRLVKNRDSHESSRSRSSASLFAPLPFPLLRSQSSNTSPKEFTVGSPEPMTPRPRCRTDSDLPPRTEKGSDAPAIVLSSSARSSSDTASRPMWPYGRSYSSSRSPSRPSSRLLMVNIPDLPERRDTVTPEEYAELAAQVFEEAGCLSFVYEQLASHPDSFYVDTLRFLLQKHFSFKDYPVDMALRLFLLEARLPGEAQQIERVLQAFSQVYVAHNPDVFLDAEQALYVVFSLVILHTDTFNRNVRHKMSKSDYVQAAYTEGLATEVLEYLYDNITCAQFASRDDDLGGSVSSISAFSSGSTVDPYLFIVEKGLHSLRPTLPDDREPSYSCPLKNRDELAALQRRFAEGCGHKIQLVSPRSRPEAHIDVQEPQDVITQGRPGIVELKLVRHGALLRREAKRMLATRQPWREWGAVLTESKFYLFKNVSRAYTCDDNAPEVLARTTIDSLNATTIPAHDIAVLLAAAPRSSEDPPANQTLVLTGRGGNVTYLATLSPDDAIRWAQDLNYAAVVATYTLPDEEEARGDAIHRHLKEIRRKVSDLDEQLALHERTCRHLRLLAPLQQKTREGVMFAAGIYASKRDWCLLDRARLRCHENILELELELVGKK